MGKQIVPVIALALLCACGGGLDSPEAVADATMVGMEDFATILEGIDSKDAADSAAGDLEKVAERMAEVAQARQKLGEMTPATDAELEKKYRDRMMKVMQRIGQAAQTAGMYIAESKKCQEAFERVGEKMQSMD